MASDAAKRKENKKKDVDQNCKCEMKTNCQRWGLWS